MSRLLIFAGLLILVSAIAASAANIVIVNLDGPGEGFNDPTVVSPVGGNPGTTIGDLGKQIQEKMNLTLNNSFEPERDDQQLKIWIQAAFHDFGALLHDPTQPISVHKSKCDLSQMSGVVKLRHLTNTLACQLCRFSESETYSQIQTLQSHLNALN